MTKKLVVNCDSREIRVAVVDKDRLAEIYYERPELERVVGNIYNGQVVNILPGMQAAFVDIGIDRNAFLYINEAVPADQAAEYDNISEELQIKDFLQLGEKVMVQVIKEAIGGKGPRVSKNISLPGRFIVLLPQSSFVGISKKIEDESLREALRVMGEKLVAEHGYGMIIRTVTKDADLEQISKEYQELIEVWKEVEKKSKISDSPDLIYHDLDILPRIIRDLVNDEVDEIIIDKYEEYIKTTKNIDSISPDTKVKVSYYRENIPIFDHYQLEEALNKAMRNKVWLNNGGYLIIERTEALTVIDVNTGKYVGQGNLEETVVATNIEAAVEVAHQLRLRNLSGIIIVDFIDMHIEDNQQRVLQVLEDELKKDSIKTSVLGLTKLGLVEITRKKVRKSLHEMIHGECPTCSGMGAVQTPMAVANKIDREVRHYLRHTRDDAIILEMHQGVIDDFVGAKQENLKDIEKTFAKKIYIRPQKEEAEMAYYNIVYSGDNKEIKKILTLPGKR